MNGANLLVKKTDGEEVLLRTDLNTQVGGQISPGDRIEAEVNAVEVNAVEGEHMCCQFVWLNKQGLAPLGRRVV